MSASKKDILIIIYVGVILAGVYCLWHVIFERNKVLEAKLTDDLSAIRITLWADNKFEVESSSSITGETFKGSYCVYGNKIIFLDKHSSNDFIPDTVTIIGDKIIIEFDKEGKPITEFATYFDITCNEIQNAPSLTKCSHARP